MPVLVAVAQYQLLRDGFTEEHLFSPHWYAANGCCPQLTCREAGLVKPHDL